MRNTAALLALLTALATGGCAGNGTKPPLRGAEFNIRLEVNPAGGGSYTCTYLGGGGNGGDVTVAGPHQNNPADIKVHLKHAAGDPFVIDSGQVTDPNAQVTLRDIDAQKLVATFHDVNTLAGVEAYYKLVILDTSTSTRFDCDPKIINN